LFSNSHDVKEQWVYALSEYVLYRQSFGKKPIQMLTSASDSPHEKNFNSQTWVSEGAPGNSQGVE